MDKVRCQFDTNVIGLLETTKAVLPYMREQKSGVIVNISSISGRVTFPLGTLYHGAKFAVEGLSEALHYELEPLGIKVKIIEPGAIATDFGGRSFDFNNDESLIEYQYMVNKLLTEFEEVMNQASPASVVANVIWNAVVDNSDALRFAAGDDAKELLANRKKLSDELFIDGIKRQFSLQ